MPYDTEERITRQMMEGWAETYAEAIDALLWVANDGYDQEDLVESIEIYYDEEKSISPVVRANLKSIAGYAETLGWNDKEMDNE